MKYQRDRLKLVSVSGVDSSKMCNVLWDHVTESKIITLGMTMARADIFVPWTICNSMEGTATANHDANLLETSASFENDYTRKIQRQINMEENYRGKNINALSCESKY